VIILCLFSYATEAQYGGGTGEPNDPYLIYTAEQMNSIGAEPNDWDKHFKLMADIDLSVYTGTDFNIIGYQSEIWQGSEPFKGTFDGNGHTISNLSYTSTDEDNIGLFGYAYWSAEIRNLGLVAPDVNVIEGENVGSLVGYINGGIISNCYMREGNISGKGNIGGLVGKSYGNINASYSAGTVSGTGNSIGGLMGYNGSTIVNCYSTSDVEGNKDVGGLVGRNDHGPASNSSITNCYAIGSVSGNENVGGLTGFNNQVVFNSFWDIETSGQTISADGLGKTTAEMQTADTFRGWGACSSSGVWMIDEGNDYPRLWWENQPGEPIEPSQLSDILAGNGTKDDPFLIYTAEEMNTIGLFPCDWDKHFKLMADIDLADYVGTAFNIIGCVSDRCGWTPFTGVFDGCGHTISNFSYRCTEIYAVGLFGYVDDPNAQIKNLGMLDPDVNTEGGTIGYEVGSLVGCLWSGSLTNCYVEGGRVTNDTSCAGGLVGMNNGIIINCYANNRVSSNNIVGGLVGRNGYDISIPGSPGLIFNCCVTGSVDGNNKVGGLAGENLGDIMSCYSNASVSGHDYVGGLVGYSQGDIDICYSLSNVEGNKNVGGLVGESWFGVVNCYSAGSVLGQERVGGLVGFNPFGGEYTVASFWDVETSGQTTSYGGIGKTTVEMQDPNMFADSGWNFFGASGAPGDIWVIPANGGYPILWWQLSESELPELPSFSGGTGEPNNPFLIDTVEQLNSIGHNPRLMDSHFRLINDVDLTNVHFYPIGNEVYPFRGVFDGSGFEISNFTYTSIKAKYAGLFGYINGHDAEVRNLGLIDPNIESVTDLNMGSLVGGIGDGTIIGCYVKGGSISGKGYNGDYDGNIYIADSIAGGLVGTSYGKIINCRSDCIVFGSRCAGGLVGISGGLITVCTFSGNVWTDHCAGGLLGSDSYRGTSIITNCYSTGSVVGRRDVGGLVGDNGDGIITNCYSTGSVVGGEMVGGLVGNNDDGLVEDSFWDIETSWQTTSTGGAGLATTEMQMQSTFTDVGWDFVDETTNGTEDIWWIDEGQDYPRLWWEMLVD
jgi:hypothetical protein